MRIKPAIAAVVVSGLVVGYAYLRDHPSLTSQLVQTCEKTIMERLAVPSTYQRQSVDASAREVSWDEFFAEPERSVSDSTRKAMIQAARLPPVQFIALIAYQAQDSTGAIIRESATCTFNSLDGSDAPSATAFMKIDGERNVQWAARQPNAATLQRGLRQQP
ncbi:hypothetical protein LQG66_08055 [Bradyrhizobium ontarionense]|uniref:Uncharacterized protein n=1 Tax=Bradyrhizobium ontarionense TaxID=2898149 RepID=A0ABY3RHW5_9BRAD|nr:hypothetical protein [Bradyrhizobium sp. A19]UFZ06239.1 hypothetical protein LQG66_08055 [Bradyrhizobium sp. A19]